MTTTGERLTRLREKLGKSQAQIAELIGVDRTSYAKYEKDVNKPTRKLKELSELFNVTSDYIMCLSDTPTAPAKEDSLSIKAGIALAKSGHKTIGMEPLTPEELSLIEAYRQANEHEKTIVNTTLKLNEIAGNETDKENLINTAILNLKKNIASIDGLQCSQIASAYIPAENLDHLLKTNLIRSIIIAQIRDSHTYLVPEMFYMKDFIDSLHAHLSHYDAEPQITTEAFKVSCIDCLDKLRSYEYTDWMFASETDIENHQTLIIDGFEYCAINGDFYRVEKNGPGRFILTKMPRPPYDPKPRKKIESTRYRKAA